MIKLYTAQWCDPCQELKQWMKANNISDVEIIDIDESPERASAANVKSVPILMVGDRAYLGREEIKPYLEHLNG